MKTTLLRASEICFGLDRKTDELSIRSFIKRFGDDDLLDYLVPKLDDNDIQAILNTITTVMKKHLDEKEYHTLFLSDR